MLIVCPAILIAVLNEKLQSKRLQKKDGEVVSIAGMAVHLQRVVNIAGMADHPIRGGQHCRNDILLPEAKHHYNDNEHFNIQVVNMIRITNNN